MLNHSTTLLDKQTYIDKDKEYLTLHQDFLSTLQKELSVCWLHGGSMSITKCRVKTKTKGAVLLKLDEILTSNAK